MEQTFVPKNGFKLRAVKCPQCHDQIIHPADQAKYEKFDDLKGKTYNVKLRLVGNSHAVSIPKEIIDFIHKQEEVMDDMVRLCFEDMHRISLMFGDK